MKTPRNTNKILIALVGNTAQKCSFSTTGLNAASNTVQQHLSNQKQVIEKVYAAHQEKVLNQKVNLTEDRPGDVARHNWSLGKAQVFPQYDAYRNADNETLAKKSFGQVDGEKNFLKVKQIDNTQYDRFVSQAKTSTEGYTVKDEKFHKRTQREVGWYLSYAPATFTQDGCFGSANQTTCLVRVVSDNSVSGLFLKNMILPTRNIDSSLFKYDSLILHAPGFQFVPSQVVEEFSGPHPKDLGLSKEQFLFENDQTNTSVVGGVFSPSVLLDNLAYFGARAIFTKSNGSAIVLPSDAIINKDKASTTLLINSNNTVRSALASNNSAYTLYGAHYNVLSEFGLSRGVGGLLIEADADSALSKSLKEGDLVEESVDGKKLKITSKLSSSVYPNVVHSPKNIVFVVEDSNFLVPLLGKVKNAQQLFASGLVNISANATFNKSFTTFGTQRSYADAKQVAEAFAKLNKAENVYIVNGSYDSEKVQTAVSLISSGEAKSLKEEQSNTLFSTLSHSSIENKAWKDQTKYSAAIKQLEENIAKSL